MQGQFISSGCCFVEVEVDMPLGQVTVKDIVNVHDSGMLISPELAEAQVHGSMSMGLGYGLSRNSYIMTPAGLSMIICWIIRFPQPWIRRTFM